MGHYVIVTINSKSKQFFWIRVGMFCCCWISSGESANGSDPKWAMGDRCGLCTVGPSIFHMSTQQKKAAHGWVYIWSRQNSLLLNPEKYHWIQYFYLHRKENEKNWSVFISSFAIFTPCTQNKFEKIRGWKCNQFQLLTFILQFLISVENWTLSSTFNFPLFVLKAHFWFVSFNSV